MICVKCHRVSTNVTNSRPHKKRASVWRRRSCSNCGFVFTTTEAPLPSNLLEVVYVDGTSAVFNLPRLTVNLYGFLTHYEERAADTAYSLSETIYQTLITRGNTDQAIPIHEFVTTTYQVLNRFDALAGLQYATKYRILVNIRKNNGRPRIK